MHLVIELFDSWLSVPTFADMKGLRAEVQVRTTAQHIWAAASHTLQYKHEESIPPPIRRAIHRASALLEIVDLEFERVLEQRENYREGVSVDIDNQLNSDLLEKVLDSILPEKNKVLDREDYADLLEDLFYFDIKTQKQLIDLWKKHRSASLKEDSERAKEKLQVMLREHLQKREQKMAYSLFMSVLLEQHLGMNMVKSGLNI